VKRPRSIHQPRGVPRDVTRTDVIDDDDDDDVTSGVSAATEWRLGELWIDNESDSVCQQHRPQHQYTDR